MKKLIKRIWLPVFLLALFGPFLVPVTSSGTLTKEQAAAQLWDDQSQWLNAAGHDVHYITAGDPDSDRLILLMHGFGASAFSYKEVLEPLSEVGFVVAYDRAAFGFTERPTEWELNPYGHAAQIKVINTFIDQFGIDKEVYLVGHSAGGYLAGAYAIENQDRIDGLVLFAPAILRSGGSPSWLNWILSLPQINHIGPLLVSSIATNGLSILYTSYYNEDNVTQSTLDGYTAPLKVNGWEKAFWEFNRAPRGPNIRDSLNQITIPTLVITGDTDRIVATEDSVQVSKLIKGSQLVVIPKTGHLPNEEKPGEFAEALANFIQGINNQ
jgi:pimeloyl-ACP methyl ester carboxylesterase